MHMYMNTCVVIVLILGVAEQRRGAAFARSVHKNRIGLSAGVTFGFLPVPRAPGLALTNNCK